MFRVIIVRVIEHVLLKDAVVLILPLQSERSVGVGPFSLLFADFSKWSCRLCGWCVLVVAMEFFFLAA